MKIRCQPAILILALVLLGTGSSAQAPAASAAGSLAAARRALRFEKAAGRVLHYRANAADVQNYQSDRSYPPYFSAMQQQEVWFDAPSGVRRVATQTIFPGSPLSPAIASVDDGVNAAMMRGERILPIARRQAVNRNLDPWAVIADWSKTGAVRVAGTETYREYPRLVLERETPQGKQRLFLDPKTSFPVKLEFTEPHYLWGQRHIEYLWSTWVESGGVFIPGATFRLADGELEVSQTLGAAELLAPDAAPALTAPAAPAQPPADAPLFLQPIAPKATRISDRLHLLSNPGYTEAIFLAGDDVYILEATQGAERARQDAELVAKLFPGKHRINVVVTDLAWPHIAGVRWWVSQGATIIAHSSARDFLQKVADRHWTLAPDDLEKTRSAGRRAQSSALKFVGIDRPTDLAGGAIRLAPIDGIGSEGALLAYVPGDRFLWASDYVQTLREPSLYAREVIAAVERNGFAPEKAAAQHLPLTDWKAVVDAQK